jgi:isopentenyl-diphosphate Delta-isomerase
MPTRDVERVVLVNDRDEEIGTEEKLRAHRLTLMHRAFSIFLFNSAGEILLQRRSEQKYHSAGLWSNTACGHPRPGEPVNVAARRRLHEEMGVDCPLTEVTAFTYCFAVSEELTENEYDHILVGVCDRIPEPDPAEVSEWEWRTPDALDHELWARPERFSRWLPLAWQAIRRSMPTQGFSWAQGMDAKS